MLLLGILITFCVMVAVCNWFIKGLPISSAD